MIKKLGINKRDGIHPDTERDCRVYYQCVSQNKMKEAKCPGDQKFSSYTGRCGPASSAPMPCGSYIPGNAPTQCKFYFSIYNKIFIYLFFFHFYRSSKYWIFDFIYYNNNDFLH
jgi:hypothetical protein